MDRRALVDERIKTLLTESDLTFKQIIEQLKSENISASFNTIRRVNRNNVFRKPRYDAKLTPQQRKELVVILKKTAKPNLSALARHFGVCHGSIWYWWDKLTKLREKHNGIIPNNEPILDMDTDMDFGLQQTGSSHSARQNISERLNANEGGFRSSHDQIHYHNDLVDLEADPLDISEEDSCENRSDTSGSGGGCGNARESYLKEEVPPAPPHDNERQQSDADQLEDEHLTEPPLDNCHVLIGPVKARDTTGQYIDLPILMYAPITGSKSHKSPTN